MICPKCLTEYNPGFTKCADCHVPLVESLPAEQVDERPPDSEARFIKVLETTDLTDVVQIKAALDASDIRYFIQGDIIRSLRPVDPSFVMVLEEDAEKAVDILKTLNLRYMRMNFSKDH